MKTKLFIAISIFLCSCHTTKKIVNNTSSKKVNIIADSASNINLYKNQIENYARIIDTYPLKDSNNYAFVGTTNFNMRKPNFVIIHHTAQGSCDETIRTFTLTRTQVSAHYVICREGNVYHMLNDYLRAWHAGISKWGNTNDINSSSIGIELDNNGEEPFSNKQIESLLKLLKRLKNAYNIPTSNFIGHADIAPTRKNDPSSFFPWKKLADNGFGNWYETQNIELPFNYNYIDGLKIIGYDVRNLKSAIKAFKLHFDNTDITEEITDDEKKMIFSLAQKN